MNGNGPHVRTLTQSLRRNSQFVTTLYGRPAGMGGMGRGRGEQPSGAALFFSDAAYAIYMNAKDNHCEWSRILDNCGFNRREQRKVLQKLA